MRKIILLIVLLLPSPLSAAPITYRMAIGELTGSITTDGHLGQLSPGDVLAWSFADHYTAGDSSPGLHPFIGTTNLAATATELLLPFAPSFPQVGAGALELGDQAGGTHAPSTASLLVATFAPGTLASPSGSWGVEVLASQSNGQLAALSTVYPSGPFVLAAVPEPPASLSAAWIVLGLAVWGMLGLSRGQSHH